MPATGPQHDGTLEPLAGGATASLRAALHDQVMPVLVDDELLLLDRAAGRVVRLDDGARHRLAAGDDELRTALDGLGLGRGTEPDRREALTTAGLAALGVTLLALPSAAAATSPGIEPEGGAPAGSVDAFDPDLTETTLVFAVLEEAAGTIVIAGGFTKVGDVTRNRLARLNADGSLTAFDPDIDGTVYALAQQADGKLLVGGDFFKVGGVTRNKIARFNVDGTLDAGFDPNANQAVRAILLQGTDAGAQQIVVGGSFTGLGGQSRDRIARLEANGALDEFPPSNNGANGQVWSLAADSQGRIIVGGEFTLIAGNSSGNRLARLTADGALSSFPNVDGTIFKVAVAANDDVVIVGLFETVNVESRNRIARLQNPADAMTVDSFNPITDTFNFGEAVLVQSDGRILIAGSFTTVGGVGRSGLARFETNGTLDTSFDPDVSGDVYAMVQQADGRILLGGTFTAVDGEARRGAARVSS